MFISLIFRQQIFTSNGNYFVVFHLVNFIFIVDFSLFLLYNISIRRDLKGLVVKESSDTIYALLGIENQSEIHYAMPVRNLLYDTLNYASQVSKKSAEYRKTRKEQREKRNDRNFKETKAEFLSGFQKEDRLKPVFTLTVYFGTDDWDAPRSLREMFDIKEHSLLELLPDYPLLLILPKEISDFGLFHSEFGHLMHIIGVSDDRYEMKQFIEGLRDNHFSLNHTAAEILNEFIGFSIQTEEQEEEVDMGKVCKALLDERQLGIQEERKIIVTQLHKEGFSVDFIARIVQIPENEVANILSYSDVKAND